jgi:hypothetical protein
MIKLRPKLPRISTLRKQRKFIHCPLCSRRLKVLLFFLLKVDTEAEKTDAKVSRKVLDR